MVSALCLLLRLCYNSKLGDLAQLGERLPCTQEVRGSIPLVSTICTLKTEQCENVSKKKISRKVITKKKFKVLTSRVLTTRYTEKKPVRFFKEEIFNESPPELLTGGIHLRSSE